MKVIIQEQKLHVWVETAPEQLERIKGQFSTLEPIRPLILLSNNRVKRGRGKNYYYYTNVVFFPILTIVLYQAALIKVPTFILLQTKLKEAKEA